MLKNTLVQGHKLYWQLTNMTTLCLSYFQCAKLFSGILCLWMIFCWRCAFSKTLLRECATLLMLFQPSQPLKGCINDRDITELFYWLCFWAQHKAPHCWLLCLIIKVSSSHSKQFLISVVADQQLVLLRARPLIPPTVIVWATKIPLSHS